MPIQPYDDMPEPPPFDDDPWMPPHPDDAYFMALDDPWGPPEPPDFAEMPDPWLPEDERFMPDPGPLPDVPSLSQDGLQGFETPEPVETGWSWHDTQLIGVERASDEATAYEIGCLDLYSNVNTGEVGGHYLPMAAFSDRDVASAFYQDANREMEEQGLAAHEIREFAQEKTVALNEEPQAWREAGVEEYAAYAYLHDVQSLDLADRDHPPEQAIDPLMDTLLELDGRQGERVQPRPDLGGPSTFEALSAIGVEAEGFDPAKDPPPFYDAETGTAYWIGVFQPDKEDRETCVTSILSLGRHPETGEMEAQLAPCVPGDWDKAYSAAEYLIEVAQKGGMERCFEAAEGMALATDQRDFWETERGLTLDQDAARNLGDYTANTWEMEL